MSKYKVEVEYKVKKYIWIEADNSSKAVQMVEDSTELYNPMVNIMGSAMDAIIETEDCGITNTVISVQHLEGDITNNT
jgi:hypothetical protein